MKVIINITFQQEFVESYSKLKKLLVSLNLFKNYPKKVLKIETSLSIILLTLFEFWIRLFKITERILKINLWK